MAMACLVPDAKNAVLWRAEHTRLTIDQHHKDGEVFMEEVSWLRNVEEIKQTQEMRRRGKSKAAEAWSSEAAMCAI